MYSQHRLKSNRLIKTGVFLTLSVSYFGALLNGLKFMDWTLPQIAFTTVALFVVGCWCIFERFLWKWVGFNVLTKTPDLNGRWKGKRDSTVDGKETEMVLEIFQTLTTIDCWTYTAKGGHASSYSANLLSNTMENSFQLVFVYQQKGIAGAGSYPDDNHDGFCILRIVNNKDKKKRELIGIYVNSRPAKADVNLVWDSKDLKEKF